MSKRFNISKFIFTAVITLLTLNIFFSANVFAEAGNGNGDTRRRESSVGYGRAYGSTWMYYSYNGSANVTFPSVGAGKSAVAMGKCGEYGGFYALVNVGYNYDSESFTSYPVGSNQLRNLQPLGGGYRYRTDVSLSDTISAGGATASGHSTGESLEAIQSKFLSMPEDARMGYSWGSNSTLGWFCYGDGPTSNSSGKVHSTSAVAASTGGEMISDLDSQVTMSVAKTLVSAGGVTATFTHRIVSDVEPSLGLQNINIKWSVSGQNASSNNAPSGTQNLSTGGWTRRPDGKWETIVSVSTSVPVGTKKICQRIDFSPQSYNTNGSGSGKNWSQACISTTSAGSSTTCSQLGGTSTMTINYGNTKGISKVRNLNNSSPSWASEVWARPGDTVQFAHCFSWGVQAVRKSDSYGAARSNPSSKTSLSDKVDYSWYRVYAQRGDQYLFGLRKDQGSIGQQVTIKRFNPVAYYKGTNTKIKAEENGNYQLTLMSPSNNKVDDTRYNCLIFDFSQFVPRGFQIPGFRAGYGTCEAANATGQTEEVGKNKVISQSIEYEYQEAWVHENHTASGSCTCSPLTSPARKDRKYYNSKNLGYPGGNGSISNDGSYHSSFNNCTTTSCAQSGTPGGPCPAYTNAGRPGGCSCYLGQKYRYRRCYNKDTKSYYDCSDPAIPSVTTCPGYTERPLSTRHPVHYADYGTRNSTAKVNTPYNFNTADTSSINAGSVIYAGETVSSAFTASVLPRRNTSIKSTNSAYATIYPGQVKIEQFVIPANSKVPTNAKNGVYSISSTMCKFFGGQNCNSSNINIPTSGKQDANWLNAQGRYSGWTWSASYTYNVPNNVEIGSKYCVAIGMTIADSHSKPNAASVSGWENLNSKWRVSLSCRTIAKKPNFQAWNANVFTDADIDTSTANKYDQAKLGTNSAANRTFGSWAEYGAIVRGSVSGFATGAALGYNAGNLALPGGHSPNSNFCVFSRLSVANNKNDKCDNVGHSKISVSGATLKRFFARYAPSSMSVNNPSSVINVNNATKLSATADNSVTTGVYVATSGNASINSTIVRPANSPLLVIRVPGTLTINSNICYGGGSCSGSDNSLILNNRNSQYFTSLSQLPQVLIIANNIDISANVTQVDAWLVAVGDKADEGIVDTCNSFEIGTGSSDDCNKTLIINGPTIANTVKLNRTAGALTRASATYGDNTADGASNNLADDGSVTPAEIFNYRPDTLLWSYGQSQNFSQATVTYERELPPRY